MSALLTIITCGNEKQTSVHSDDNRICLQSGGVKPVEEMSAAHLQELIQTCDSDYLTFVNANTVTTDALAQIDGEFITELLTNQPAVVVLPIRTVAEHAFVSPVWAWQLYPAHIASLLTPMSGDVALLLPREQFQQRPLRELSNPLHDYLIRITAVESNITFTNNPLLGEQPVYNSHSQTPRLAPANPSRQQLWLRDHLHAACSTPLFAQAKSTTAATALMAGLFLLHDYLEESHALSQSIEGQGDDSSGDYWHAIMHRREPDYSNAKYWIRRVGQHPVHSQLYDLLSSNLQNLQADADDTGQLFLRQIASLPTWNPTTFVDFCQTCEQAPQTNSYHLACAIQYLEMRLLLEHCYAAVVN